MSEREAKERYMSKRREAKANHKRPAEPEEKPLKEMTKEEIIEDLLNTVNYAWQFVDNRNKEKLQRAVDKYKYRLR